MSLLEENNSEDEKDVQSNPDPPFSNIDVNDQNWSLTVTTVDFKSLDSWKITEIGFFEFVLNLLVVFGRAAGQKFDYFYCVIKLESKFRYGITKATLRRRRQLSCVWGTKWVSRGVAVAVSVVGGGWWLVLFVVWLVVVGGWCWLLGGWVVGWLGGWVVGWFVGSLVRSFVDSFVR